MKKPGRSAALMLALFLAATACGSKPPSTAPAPDGGGTACPADPFNADHTPCSQSGASCGGCGDCEMCHILICQNGRWSSVEVFPAAHCFADGGR